MTPQEQKCEMDAIDAQIEVTVAFRDAIRSQMVALEQAERRYNNKIRELGKRRSEVATYELNFGEAGRAA